MIRSCYIHIPFCKKICSYCDFCKLFYDTGYVLSYLDSLDEEILKNYQEEELNTIYIGGGTPSCLSICELKYLFSILSRFKRSKDCEITIEANFDSITKEKIDLFLEFGINRISFGMETTHEWILKKMNRSLDLSYVKEIICYCREKGLTNINLDLMYAFPGESIQEVEEDVSFLLSLDVNHISTYSLILEEHTSLYLQHSSLVDEDMDARMYQRICEMLKDYVHYETSNFAKDGKYSRHNLCYWNNWEYYGFGLGASGYILNIRYANTRSMTHYLQGNYRYQEEKLSTYDKMEYEVILNLRTKWGISKNKFFQFYGKNLEEVYPYQKLIDQGYLIEKDDNIIIPYSYWYLSNEIIVKLLEGCCYE
ncbi:MAG TPA: radical SAM family heme chaperone HemW [Candidatus Faecimonas gallistercoris]|nr:radical SAM family heme chaperone HemW [Candidatus Faecimonas gallistercoris]